MSTPTAWSAYSLVKEPDDLWTRRLSGEAARAPRVEPRGADPQWVVDEGRPFGAPEDPPLVADSEPATTADVAREHLDRHGLAVSVLFPDVARRSYRALREERLGDALRVYNDWVLELAAGLPGRLLPVTLLDPQDPQGAIAELERTARLGAAGCALPLCADDTGRYDDVRYDPLFSAAAALGRPLCFQAGTVFRAAPLAKPFDTASHQRADEDPLFQAIYASVESSYVLITLAALVFSGVAARVPGLRVVVAGFDAGWFPYLATRFDEMYEVRPERLGPAPPEVDPHSDPLEERFRMATEYRGYSFPEGERPSDHLRRLVSAVSTLSPLDLKASPLIGAQRLLWGTGARVTTDVGESAPRVDERLRGAGVKAEARHQLLTANACAMFGQESRRA